MNGRSCTSIPMQWPIRWRKCSPRPASSIGRRQAAFTSRAGVPGLRGGASGFLGGEHDLVGLEVVVRRLAAVDRAAEVGAVAVDDAAEVEHHRGALRHRLVRRRRVRSRSRSSLEPGEDVRRERRAARSGARGARARPLPRARPWSCRASTSGVTRPSSARPSRSRAASPRAPRRSSRAGARSPALSRCVSARRRRCGRGGASSRPRRGRRPRRSPVEPRLLATRSKIATPSSVSVTTTSSPSGGSRRSNAANMRGSTKTGSVPGTKKAPVTQPLA